MDAGCGSSTRGSRAVTTQSSRIESAGSVEFDQTHDLTVVRMPLSMSSWGALGWSGGSAYLNMYRQIKEVVDQQEISQIHVACVLPEGFLAWMLQRRLGLPFTVYVHGEELNIVSKSRELTWMSKRVLGNANRIITNSENTANILLSSWPVQRERLRVASRRRYPTVLPDSTGPCNSQGAGLG